MTNIEMVNAVRANNITEKLIDALVEFKWNYDPYGIMEAFGGHIDDEGVREQVIEEVKYLLENDREILIDELEFDAEQ